MIVKAILVYSGLLYFLKPVRSAAFIEWCEEATERRRFTLDKCSQYPFVYPYPDCYCLNGIALVKVAHDSRPIREINFGKNGCFSHKALGASNRTIELLPVEFAENDTLVGYEKAGSQTSFEFVKVPSGATPQEFPNNTLVIYNGELFDTNEDYNDKPLYCIQKNSNQDTAQQVRYYQLFPETYIWLNETCDGGNYVDLELISAGRLLTEGNQKCVPKCGKYDANAPIRVPTRKSGFVDYSNSEEFGLEKSCKPVPNHLRDVHKDLNERILKHSIERAFYDQQSYKVDYKPSYSFKIMELLSKITSKYCRHARIPNNFLEQALDYFKVAHEGRGFYFSEDFSFADYNSISRMLRRCLFYMNQTIQFTSEGCGSGHNIISVFRDSPKVDAKVVHSTATHQYFDHHVVLDIPWNMLDLANVVCVNAFSKSYRMYHLMEQGIEKLFTNELRSFWLYPDVPNFYYENLYGPYWRSVARNLEKCVDSAYMYNPKMARLIRPQWIPGNQRSSRRRGTIVDPICERRRSDLELISQNYEIYCASPGKESGGSGDADKLANMTIIDWPDASGTENGGYAGSKPLIDFPDYTGGNAGGYTGNKPLIDFPDNSGDSGQGSYTGNKPLIDFPDNSGGAGQGSYTGNKPLIDFPDNSGDSGQGSYTGNKPLIDFPDNSGGSGQSSYTGNKPLIDFPDNSGGAGQGSYAGNKPLIDFPENSGGSTQGSYTGSNPLIDFPENNNGGVPGGQNGIDYKGSKPLIDFPTGGAGGSTGNVFIDFPKTNQVPGETSTNPEDKNNNNAPDLNLEDISILDVLESSEATEHRIGGEGGQEEIPSLNFENFPILDDATEGDLGHQEGTAKSDSTPEKDGSAFDELPAMNFDNFPIMDVQEGGDGGGSAAEGPNNLENSTIDNDPTFSFDNFPVIDLPEDFESNGGGVDTGASGTKTDDTSGSSANKNGGIPVDGFENYNVVDFTNKDERGESDAGSGGGSGGGESSGDNGGKQEQPDNKANEGDMGTSNGSVGRPTDTPKNEDNGQSGSAGSEDTKVPTTKHPPPEKESGNADSAGSNQIVKPPKPSKEDSQGEGSKPVDESVIGDGGKPIDDSVIGDGGKPIDDSVIGDGGKPIDDSVIGDGGKPVDESVIGDGGKPIDDSVIGDGGKPIDDSVIGDGGKPIDDSVIGDGGKPVDDSVIGDGGKPIDDSVSGDGGKPIDDSVIGDGGNTISVTTEKTVSPEIGSEDNNGNDNYLDNLPALTFPEDTETGNGIGPGDTPSDPAPPDGSNAGGQDGSPRDGSSNEHVYIKWPDDAASGDQVYLKWPKEPGYPSNPEDPDQDQVYLKWPNEPGNPGDSDADRVYLKWPEEPSSFRNTQPGQRSVFVDDIDPITNNEEELPNDARAAIYKRYIHPNQQQVPNQNAYAFPREFSNPRGLYQDPADTPYVINDVGNEFSLDRYDTAEGVKPYRRSMEPYSQLGRAIPSGQPLGDSSDYLRWPEKGIDPSEAYLRWPQKRIDPNEAYLRWPEKRIDPNEAYLRWPQKGIEPDDYLKWPQLNPIQPNPGTGDPSTPPRSRPLLDFPDYDPVPAPGNDQNVYLDWKPKNIPQPTPIPPTPGPPPPNPPFTPTPNDPNRPTNPPETSVPPISPNPNPTKNVYIDWKHKNGPVTAKPPVPVPVSNIFLDWKHKNVPPTVKPPVPVPVSNIFLDWKHKNVPPTVKPPVQVPVSNTFLDWKHKNVPPTAKPPVPVPVSNIFLDWKHKSNPPVSPAPSPKYNTFLDWKPQSNQQTTTPQPIAGTNKFLDWKPKHSQKPPAPEPEKPNANIFIEWPPKRKHSPPSNQPPKDPNNSDGKEASERQGRNVRDDVSITYTEDPRRSNQLHQRSTILRHPLSQELMPTISTPETASISYYRPLGNLQSKEYTPDNAKPQPRASGKSIKPLRPIEFQPKGNKMKVFKRESFKLNVTNSSTVDHSSYPRFPKNSLMLETYNPMNIHLKCPTQHSFSPMSNNCTHFYTCIPDSDAEDQLLMLLLKCRPSMHFDPKLQDCIPGDCLQLEFASPAPESLKVNYSAVKVQTGRAAEFNANCTSSKKMLPIPEDCRNYLVCSNIYGDWYVNKYECPQNTYFREFSGCVEGTCM